MWKMRLVISAVGYINLILFCYIFWNNAPQRLYGEPLAGMVVDGTTGKPIAGAYVSYLWQAATDPKGFFGSGGRSICYHAAGTVTDSSGRFHVDPWSRWSTYRVANQDPQVLVYVPGYEPISRRLHTGDTVLPIPRVNELYGLQPESGSQDQRFTGLFYGIANQYCSYGGESQKSLYPMLKAIYTELRERAQTTHERETVHIIGQFAASAALAPDPDGPGDRKRLNRFIEEQLQ